MSDDGRREPEIEMLVDPSLPEGVFAVVAGGRERRFPLAEYQVTPLGTRCPACGIPDDQPMDSAPLPAGDEARFYCACCGRRLD